MTPHPKPRPGTPRTRNEIYALFRFRCEFIGDTPAENGHYHDVRIYWLAPSGKAVYLDIRTINHEDTCALLGTCFHPERKVVVDHTNPAFRIPYQTLINAAHANRLTGAGRWLANIRPPYPGTSNSRRYCLSNWRCKALGQLVRQHLARDIECQEIVDWLNDHCPDAAILERIAHCLDEPVIEGVCGHFLIEDDGYPYRDGGQVCHDCVDDGKYFFPEDGSAYWAADDVYQHNDGYYYTYPEDDGEGWDADQNDYNDEDTRGMCSYNCDVTAELGGASFASTATGPFTIGVELEVHARRGQRGALVDTITAQQGQQIICKHDGSLDEFRGVELVTRPMAYPAAVTLFKTLAFPQGTVAWNALRCGMHVHIDSRAFTRLSAAKFLAFWNEPLNAGFIRQVAGRHPRFDAQAREYAAAAGVPNTGSVLAKAKHHDHGAERYRIVNLLNLSRPERLRLGLTVTPEPYRPFSTLELRIFRASLRKERLLAQIELAAASVYFSRDTSLRATGADEFEDWLRGNTALFPHLASFLGLIRPLNRAPGSPVTEDETVAVD